MRIRRRLGLYGAAVTAAVIMVFGLALGVLVRLSAPTEQARLLTTFVEDAMVTLGSIDIDELAGASPLLPVDPATSDDPFVTAAAEDGTILYSTAALSGNAPRLPAAVVVEALETGTSTATFVVDGVELRVVAIAANGPDGSPRVIAAAQPTRTATEQAAGFTALVIVVGVMTFLAGGLVSWLVTGRAMRPLRELVDTTDRIAETGDLTERLTPPKTDDEIGRLTDSFNGMLSQLESTREKLTVTLGTQRRFVADASHELRSPLTTIRTNAGFLLERDDISGSDRREAIGDIAAEADRMTHLVDDLLLLARLDGGRPLGREPVDLVTVSETIKRRASTLGTPVRVEAPLAVAVVGDQDALTRILWILVDNAIRHGSEPIELKIFQDDTGNVIRVGDSGPGFSSSDETRLFERFNVADPSRTSTGAGLGLAIAHDIVVAHGGTIVATNAAGGGALITVTLPHVAA